MNTFFLENLFGEADLGDSLVGEAKSWERVGKQKCGEERDFPSFPSFPACPPQNTHLLKFSKALFLTCAKTFWHSLAIKKHHQRSVWSVIALRHTVAFCIYTTQTNYVCEIKVYNLICNNIPVSLSYVLFNVV